MIFWSTSTWQERLTCVRKKNITKTSEVEYECYKMVLSSQEMRKQRSLLNTSQNTLQSKEPLQRTSSGSSCPLRRWHAHVLSRNLSSWEKRLWLCELNVTQDCMMSQTNICHLASRVMITVQWLLLKTMKDVTPFCKLAYNNNHTINQTEMWLIESPQIMTNN